MLAEGLAGPRAWDSEIRDSGDGELWGPRGKTRPPKSTGIQKFSTRSPANTTGLWVRVRSATRATRVCPLVCSRHANTPGVSRCPLPPSSLLLSRGHSPGPVPFSCEAGSTCPGLIPNVCGQRPEAGAWGESTQREAASGSPSCWVPPTVSVTGCIGDKLTSGDRPPDDPDSPLRV